MRGYTIIEMLTCVAISLILTSITVPSVQQTLNTFNLKAAASSASWAVQSTRYLALMNGYPYEISFSTAPLAYQVLSKPTGAPSFSNVGGAVNLVNSGTKPTLNQATTLQFLPNGTVSATAGALNFNLTLGNLVENVSVTASGSVKVTP